MASRIMIFDHFCKPLAEINAPTTPRSWILNDIGRCEFSISTSDPACTLTNMQYGNLLYIEHLPTKDETNTVNGKLPVWVGMILPPRKWSLGALHVVAYSAESILSFRAMPHVLLKGSPKTVFTEILKYSREVATNIIIQPGIVDDLDVPQSADLRLSAFEHIRNLARDAKMDFDVTGELNENKELLLYANLYRKKGSDTPLEINNTNSELSDPLLTEQGAPTNYVHGYSQASTRQNRWKGIGINQEAVDDYGYLEANIVFMGMHEQAEINFAAQAQADLRGRPVKIAHRIALDEKDTFSFLGTGNRLVIQDTSVGFAPGGGFGFSKKGRVLSVEYNDLSNKVPLNVDITQ